MTLPADEGGEAACWLHMFESPLPDIGGRVHVEQFMQRLLNGVSDAGDAPIDAIWTTSPSID